MKSKQKVTILAAERKAYQVQQQELFLTQPTPEQKM